MSTLIIISCSERKLRKPRTPIPAIERYDGVFYRLIRKAQREGRLVPSLSLVILSAKYGLLRPQSPISHYEQRIDATRIPILRPGVQGKLKALLRRKRFEHIYVNLGKAYEPLIDGIAEIEEGVWAVGGIGTRAQTLRNWIDSEATPSQQKRARE